MSTDHRIVVMGVAGSGKSTVADALARRLHAIYVDADSLHPPRNIATMTAGIPLSDDDRWPWLRTVGDTLGTTDEPMVLACSALRRVYRDLVRDRAPQAVFIHLSGSRDLLAQRMSARPGHFMPTRLLDSQLATLEPLEDDERGFTIDIAPQPGTLVDLILDRLGPASSTGTSPG